LNVANASFEKPPMIDAAFNVGPGYAQQGGYGWGWNVPLGTGAGTFNPPANTYNGAASDNPAVGGDGAHAAYVYDTFNFAFQQLAGPDGTPGNADDPLVTRGTIYRLTVGVGQRLPGSQYGNFPFGGYDIQLLASNNSVFTIMGQETNAAAIPAGEFTNRTIEVDSSTLAAGLYGQALYIRLGTTVAGGITDFDNVRLEIVPPAGDFNGDLQVNNEDFLIWQRGFGIASGAAVTEGDADDDGDVDGDDLTKWKMNFGFGSTSVAAATPEPSAGLLGWISLGGCCLRFRRLGWRSFEDERLMSGFCHGDQ
jgi:hypothetical protein